MKCLCIGKKEVIKIGVSILILFAVILTIIKLYRLYIEDLIIPKTNIKEEAMIPEKVNETEEEKFLKEQYKNKKIIALTFDDGPGKYTDKFLEDLKQREVPVTFFLLGQNIAKYSNTVAKALEYGNEIGTHGYTHKLFTKFKDEDILAEIDKSKNEIYNITGTYPTLMRVPYGKVNKRVLNIIETAHLQSVLWTVDSKDWKLQDTDKIVTYVLKKVKGNDIILMHDIFKTSTESALKIIDNLKEKGYSFVTISTFISLRDDI